MGTDDRCDNERQADAGGRQKLAGFWRKHRVLKWVVVCGLAGAAVFAGVAITLAYRAEPMLRERIVQELAEHFHARVELDSFHLSLRGGLWVEGKGLRIWPPAQVAGMSLPGTQGPGTPEPEEQGADKPLIQLKEFRFHAPLHYKPGQVIRISVVRLQGLEVDVPPRSRFLHESMLPAPATAANSGSTAGGTAAALLHFQVETLVCDGAHLTLEPSKPGKLPLEFAIAHLKLNDIGGGGAMGFEAELTNPRPAGTIHTKGSLGPWLVADPGESPVAGSYRFENADLGGFKGIAGILNSTGSYQGTLRELIVDGETKTPDFRLTHFGTALPLETKFHARVDATNGDTWLEPVEATLGGSHMWVEGPIVGVKAEPDGRGGMKPGGHDIALKVNVDRGRIEDFLRLASHGGTPLLTGALATKVALEIPPGPVPVEQRLTLNGTFTLDDAEFSSAKIQARILELSSRGQGHPKDAKKSGQPDVLSTMNGTYLMKKALITLPVLEYTVPGAVIDLKGSYAVDGGALDFQGKAKMQATVSAMVGGWKGLLLKPVDRYFQKDGAGTEVPIQINGTRENPQFGVDFNRMKLTSPQRSGDGGKVPAESNPQ